MSIDIAMIVTPGEILEDMMVADDLTPEQLAATTDLPLSCIEGIIAGKHIINDLVAAHLEAYFYQSAETWLNRQQLYNQVFGENAMPHDCAGC